MGVPMMKVSVFAKQLLFALIVIFEISTPVDCARAGNAFSQLYLFCPNGQPTCTDGSTPAGNLVSDNAGNLYGTTAWGGAYSGACVEQQVSSIGCGTVFKVAPDGVESVLYAFCANGT